MKERAPRKPGKRTDAYPLAHFIIDKKATFKLRELPPLPSRKKMTLPGLIKRARAARKAGNIDTNVEAELFTIPVYKCWFCDRLEKWQADANYHMQRDHLGPKKSIKYDQGMQEGYKCRVEGCKQVYPDSRGLKTHYLDRSKH